MFTRRSVLSVSLLSPIAFLLTGRVNAQEGTVASLGAADIGLPEGVTEPRPMALNTNGEVLVAGIDQDGAPVTMIYREGSFQRIGGEDSPASGAAMNEAGVAVGWSVDGDLNSAVQFGDDNLVVMPGDYVQSRALAINVEGLIAGEAIIEDGDDFSRPVYWTESTIEVLPSAGDGQAGAVLDLNTIEQMVGWSDMGGDALELHATLWENGAATDLGTLGGNLSEARGINETGVVVGGSLTSPDQNSYEEPGTAAFSWQDGQINDLGLSAGHTWGIANDINDVGMIVGLAGLAEPGPAGNTTVAVLWADSAAHDLNEMTTGLDEPDPC